MKNVYTSNDINTTDTMKQNMHAEHSVIASTQDEIQPSDIDSDMSRLTSDNDKIPMESCFHTTSKQVANILSPPAADRKVSVEMNGENKMLTSTSPFSVTVACNKNKGNKVRYKYVRRYGQRHNCQPTKTVPRKRQYEQQKYRQDKSTIQQMYDKMKEISANCKSSAEECRKVLETMKRLLRQKLD